ncbi:LysR family transcriptional regulator [Aureimonas altamirensis]|uniref:LysR family transcriptional regulator n=1 Tax=Aureimonas altamirensis TaxID=370622 RepID=A0A0B1PYX9_9HYPH|nr:LysR family transcriptional regulator [Aureimonas altamirensis]KHJ53314.1 LysR family transcriptional regulator [Aureimonas altamirensis]
MLDRQHLAIIREVNRAGSVTAASDALNLSQSAISHAIAKLEARHRVQVWRKKGRSLELTQAGEYLLRLAERLVPEFDHAERVLADISCGRRGAMRIGMECHPCERWLMRVTRPFLDEWPDVDIELRSAFRFDGVAALQAREIDVLVTPDPVNLPELRFEPVFDYELRLVVPGNHVLADKDHIEPADLLGENLLTVPVTVERLDIYTRFLILAAFRPKSRITVENIELMLQLVVAGRGVAVLPDWLVQELAFGMPLTTLGIGKSRLCKSINVGLRHADVGTDYLTGFMAIAKRIATRMPNAGAA